jgi:hypothetical protein
MRWCRQKSREADFVRKLRAHVEPKVGADCAYIRPAQPRTDPTTALPDELGGFWMRRC